MRIKATVVAGLLAVGVVWGPAGVGLPAASGAPARVQVTNEFGKAQADPAYATALTLRGSGFQSVPNGHGGVYVFFGTVNGTWRPSKGGQSGSNYLYVPDSEAKKNQGYQRYLAFPGSDTVDSAQGIVAANGSWSTTITVPGARFNAVDRQGQAAQVNCLKVTCGIITLGAHGVKNANNETFTPVTFTDLYETGSPAPAPAPAAAASPHTDAADTRRATSGSAGTPRSVGTPKAEVDPDTAVLGRVLSFTGAGFKPGEQVIASFDEGRAAVGPLAAGASGEIAGVLQLPAGLSAGTHTLRLAGAASGARVDVNFPVLADAGTPVGREDAGTDRAMPAWAGWSFLVMSALILLFSAGFAVRRVRSSVRAREEVADA